MNLSTELDIDLVALEAEDVVTAMLELTALAQDLGGGARPLHTAIVVLDRSGSMGGERLDAAKAALVELVDRLADRDQFGLVTFDGQTQVVVPAAAVATYGRAHLKRAVSGVATGGSTDLSSGYLRGLQEARRVAGPAGATVILLSDGLTNCGVTDPVRLAAVARQAMSAGVTSSTVGIGVDYDETVLAALAEGGSGNHTFAEHVEGVVTAVAGEIDGLLTKTIQAATLLIRPLDGVSQVSVVNDLADTAVAGGVLVELGDFYGGEQRRVVLELTVPAKSALGAAQVAELVLRYVELPSLIEHTVTQPISVNVVPGDVAAQRVPSPLVVHEKQILEVQKSKKATEASLRDGDVDAARDHLKTAAASLDAMPDTDEVRAEKRWVATASSELEFRDAAFMTKKLRASTTRMSRGYKSRYQGGEAL